MPQQLEPVDMPEGVFYLWQWFCELSGGRGYNEAGPVPLTYSEIQAWANLTQTTPTAFEITTIKALDREFLMKAMDK